MEHRRIDGYNISIEQPKGSVRSGVDANGKRWENTIHYDYGYIRGTEGVDGDHIDIFLSDTPESGDVFVIDQYNPDGTFDEHKVMYGFANKDEAFKAYLSNYAAGWEKGRKLVVTGVSKEDFKKWVNSSVRKTKPFAEYKAIKGLEELKWSSEHAKNGEPFLENNEGSIDLVDIPQDVFDKIGIKKVPFRLTPSMVYHVYERHGKELKLKSP